MTRARNVISTYQPSLWKRFVMTTKDLLLLVSMTLAIGFGVAFVVADRYANETAATLQIAVQENQQLKLSLADAQLKQAQAEARLAMAMIPEGSVGEILTNHVTSPIKNGWEKVVNWFSDDEVKSPQ